MGGQQAWLGAACLLPAPAVSRHGTIFQATIVAADLAADGRRRAAELRRDLTER
jgi:hypothetical protein